MSARPGYDELVAARGREIADRIIASAELYSDGAHQEWTAALRWAIDRYDRSDDPTLAARQAENARLADDLVRRRGPESRPILYLSTRLGGDAFDYPERLTRAESIYDVDGAMLPPDAGMSDQLAWSRAAAGLDDALDTAPDDAPAPPDDDHR